MTGRRSSSTSLLTPHPDPTGLLTVHHTDRPRAAGSPRTAAPAWPCEIPPAPCPRPGCRTPPARSNAGPRPTSPRTRRLTGRASAPDRPPGPAGRRAEPLPWRPHTCARRNGSISRTPPPPWNCRLYNEGTDYTHPHPRPGLGRTWGKCTVFHPRELTPFDHIIRSCRLIASGRRRATEFCSVATGVADTAARVGDRPKTAAAHGDDDIGFTSASRFL